MLTLSATLVVAYGEGHAAIISAPMHPGLQWDVSSDVQNCAVLNFGSATASLQIVLPEDAIELKMPEMCVSFTTRTDSAENWWFVAPPPTEPPQVACVPTSSCVEGGITITLNMLLPAGYSYINAVLEQPMDSSTQLVAPLHAVVSVLAKHEGGPRPTWLNKPSPLPRLSDDMRRSLATSYRTVRDDERAEKEDFAHRTTEGSSSYASLYEWPQQPQASLDAIRGLLAPPLVRALEQPTPAALHALLWTPSHLPVYQIQLFTDEGAARLAGELAHAHALNHSAGPTNNVSDNAGQDDDEARVRYFQRDALPSLLLDEVKLKAVSHALAAKVLVPLSRLLYPHWTHGGQLDSYHAFSIHRRSHAADQRAWFRPSSNSDDASAARRGAVSNTSEARTGVHSDVCEVSLNVALMTTADFAGSRVGFEPDFRDRATAGRHNKEGAADVEGGVVWLGHSAGVAFVNLCQHRHGVDPLISGGRDTLVVRGFASSFRRAPAETFYEQCVASSVVNEER